MPRESIAMQAARPQSVPDLRYQRIKDRYLALERIDSIAASEGITRQAVWKALKKMGFDTSARRRVMGKCATCGYPFPLRIAKQRQHNNYCSSTCYMTALRIRGESYKPSVYGCRVARRIVSELFVGYDPSTHVVHHVDGDNTNNSRRNLWVFASQSDHLKYHHAKSTMPIWRGSDGL